MKKGRKGFSEPLSCADRSGTEKVSIMGGTIIETESEKLISRGRAEEIIEMGQEFGLDDTAILKRLQEKAGLSIETATIYLRRYGKNHLCKIINI